MDGFPPNFFFPLWPLGIPLPWALILQSGSQAQRLAWVDPIAGSGLKSLLIFHILSPLPRAWRQELRETFFIA